MDIRITVKFEQIILTFANDLAQVGYATYDAGGVFLKRGTFTVALSKVTSEQALHGLMETTWDAARAEAASPQAS